MRASASQRLSDPWKRLPAIHQHLKRSPRSRRGIGGSPQRSAGRRFQLIHPADTLQPATMTPTDRRLDALTRPSINALNQATGHPQSLTRRTPRAEARSHRCTIRAALISNHGYGNGNDLSLHGLENQTRIKHVISHIDG